MVKSHSVRLDRERCMGCTNCIKRCPTSAIRVRDGKARIAEERCLDCGECIRACPHHAKSAVMDSLSRLQDYAYTVALAAPSLYAQFGPPADRQAILTALRGIGFDDVYEVALGADIVSEATAAYVRKAVAEGRRPLLSSACPVVVRLIQMRFPSLIDHLIPYDSPMEVTARIAREAVCARHNLEPRQVGIFFISPCPAKRSAIQLPFGPEPSQVDGAIAMSDIYPQMLSFLERPPEPAAETADASCLAGQVGVRWAYSGGEATVSGTDRYLAVDGIHNVIAILEEVENERLADIDFIEANSCIGGCIGGVLTVANRFSAKSRHRGYVRQAGLDEDQRDEQQRCRDAALLQNAADALRPWPEALPANEAMRLDDDIETAMRKYEAMKTIVERLPGLDCGACGAPDCEALAEDIVRGEATETDCIFVLKERIRDVAAQLGVLERQIGK